MTPGRYVGFEEKEEDDEPFEIKMRRLSSELSVLYEKSNSLQATIKQNLEVLGFGI